MIRLRNLALCMLNDLQHIEDMDYEVSATLSTVKDMVKDAKEAFSRIDWNNLTLEEAKELGFRKWLDEESFNRKLTILKRLLNINGITKEDYESKVTKLKNEAELYLVPFYLHNFIPKGLELTDIFGNTIVNDGTNIKKDARFMSLAVGLKFKENNE